MHWSDMSQYCRVSSEVESAITNLALSSTFSTSYTSQLHKVGARSQFCQSWSFQQIDSLTKPMSFKDWSRTNHSLDSSDRREKPKIVTKLNPLITFYQLWAGLIKGVFLCEIDQGQCQGGVDLCPRRRSDRLGNKPNCPIKTDCFLPLSKHCFHYPFW